MGRGILKVFLPNEDYTTWYAIFFNFFNQKLSKKFTVFTPTRRAASLFVENYMVVGTIEMVAKGDTLQLFRFDSYPAKWHLDTYWFSRDLEKVSLNQSITLVSPIFDVNTVYAATEL